jgi:catechol 2,3-dioxygenase-like lactoylglutathione lyase family enzyme
MNPSLPGIHHVTAITSDAQKNIDFYCGVLGLRLVKLTVNFDDPSSYHLYYGDELGRPGTILTFFAWPGAHRGVIGPPQVQTTSFAVPSGALDFWADRLKSRAVQAGPMGLRFGESFLSFTDFDGMQLEIVAGKTPGGQPWAKGSVPVEYAIGGFHGITMAEDASEKTSALLTNVMGFTHEGTEDGRLRYRSAGADGIARFVDLVCKPGTRHGGMGAGTVHHVAYRTPDDSQQKLWRTELSRLGYNVSPVMDRNYFHSIYFREPGGVLFEIATDTPGFTADEPVERLGTKLMLPTQFESHRAEIEAALPKVSLPNA